MGCARGPGYVIDTQSSPLLVSVEGSPFKNVMVVVAVVAVNAKEKCLHT